MTTVYFCRNEYKLRTSFGLNMLCVFFCFFFQETKCLYVIIVMDVMWLSEAIPISVTALFPVFLFPMLGLSPAKDVCSKYVNVRY